MRDAITRTSTGMSTVNKYLRKRWKDTKSEPAMYVLANAGTHRHPDMPVNYGLELNPGQVSVPVPILVLIFITIPLVTQDLLAVLVLR